MTSKFSRFAQFLVFAALLACLQSKFAESYGGSETPSEPIVPDTAAEAAEKEQRLSRILFPRNEENRLRLLRDASQPTSAISYGGSSRNINIVERVSTACHHQQGAGGLVAKCTFTTPRASSIRGTLTLTQTDVDGPTTISGKITGLSSNGDDVRELHIHEVGDFSRDCMSTLGHYHPFNKTHGGPHERAERHVGDLGNIAVSSKGVAHVNIVDKVVSLFGRFSVIGRSVVIHAGHDDLGGSEFADSTNEHSGARIACCAVVYAKAEIPL